MKISIDIEPVPQARPKFSHGKCYEPARCIEYKKAVATAAKIAMKNHERYRGALQVRIKLYRKFNRTSRRYGDVDNHAKSILDALNGIVYEDDSQIVKCTIEKKTAEGNAGIVIEIDEKDN